MALGSLGERYDHLVVTETGWMDRVFAFHVRPQVRSKRVRLAAQLGHSQCGGFRAIGQ